MKFSQAKDKQQHPIKLNNNFIEKNYYLILLILEYFSPKELLAVAAVSKFFSYLAALEYHKRNRENSLYYSEITRKLSDVFSENKNIRVLLRNSLFADKHLSNPIDIINIKIMELKNKLSELKEKEKEKEKDKKPRKFKLIKHVLNAFKTIPPVIFPPYFIFNTEPNTEYTNFKQDKQPNNDQRTEIISKIVALEEELEFIRNEMGDVNLTSYQIVNPKRT